MKLFTFLMSFYLLGLSLLPCSDGKECNAKTEARVSATANHQQHEHKPEACTPFCTCSCCAASAFYSPLNKMQASKIVFQSEKYPLLDEDAKTDVLSSIWQPPQLS